MKILTIVASLLIVGSALAQSGVAKGSSKGENDPKLVPLCDMQTKLTQGERRNLRVEGVYLSGLEGQYLVTSDCAGRSTSVEFELKTHRLWKKLVRLSNRTNAKRHVSGDGDPVLVIFEGEFYGPQTPDPKVPEAIRKNYHPAWDHNSAAMTKIVVYEIRSVEPLPAEHPCASPKSNPEQWPCFFGGH